MRTCNAQGRPPQLVSCVHTYQSPPAVHVCIVQLIERSHLPAPPAPQSYPPRLCAGAKAAHLRQALRVQARDGHVAHLANNRVDQQSVAEGATQGTSVNESLHRQLWRCIVNCGGLRSFQLVTSIVGLVTWLYNGAHAVCDSTFAIINATSACAAFDSNQVSSTCWVHECESAVTHNVW